MTWSVERIGAHHVSISVPMAGGSDALLDEIQANLVPKPLADGATGDDSDRLRSLWDCRAPS